MFQPCRTVLIVDDSLEDRETYQRYLLRDSEFRYTILEAESGEEGLALCQHARPDGILLDYLLPDLNGLEFMVALKTQTTDLPPVIMLTGKGSEPIAVEAMKSGVQDYLVKGHLTPEELCLAVDRAIEKVELRHQLAVSQIALQASDRELRESESRFRSAFDHAAIGMALVSTTGQWLKVNAALCQIVGYSEIQLLQTTVESITYPDNRNQDLQLLHQLLSGEVQTTQTESRYIHKRGQIIWVRISASLVRDNGYPIYGVFQIQDITEQRAIEHIKDEFIAVVSHELRTPLTSIRGSLELVNSGLLDDEPETTKQMLDIATSESIRLSRLVTDILDLERLDSHQQLLKLQWCQATALMQQAVSAIQPIALARKITFSAFPPALEMWADPDLVMQVLINILGNAIKFSPPDSPISLSASLETGFSQVAPEKVVFAIADQGGGISAQKLHTIFDRFQQVDTSNTREKGGTGLGLSICRSIVQHHGGQIWVESVLGQGSTFFFTLPIPQR